MNKKCIIFVRCSTPQQDLSQQREKVIEEAIKHGYNKPQQIIIEHSESAVCLNLDNRQGINELKRYIELDKDIDCVFIYELSRLSRRPADLYTIRDYLIERNINLISMTPSMIMLTPDGKLDNMATIVFGIFGSLAEQEGYIRKERFARSKAKLRAEGKYTGGKIRFGYTSDKDNNFIIDRQAATTLRRIFEMYVNEGKSTSYIARELESSAHLPLHKKYSNTTLIVCHYLHQEVYCGNKFYPQIISRDLFDKAQAMLSKHGKRPHLGKNPAYFCRGLLYCGNTGERYCTNNNQHLYTTKKRYAVKMEIIHRIVIEMVNEYYFEHKKDVHNVIAKNNKDIQMIERRIANTFKLEDSFKDKIDTIWERNIEGRLSESKAQNMADECNKKIADIIQERNELYEKKANIMAVNSSYINEDGDIIEKVIDFNDFTDEDKYTELHKIAEKILILRETKFKKDIVMYFKDGSVKTRKYNSQSHNHTKK